jgi:NADH-quinone oxidoreductase subunit C
VGLTPDAVLARVATILPEVARLPLDETRGQAVVVVAADAVAPTLQRLRGDPELAFDFLADLSAVDYLGRTPRYEVVYQLQSIERHHRLRAKVAVDHPDPVVPTVSHLWKSALWAEREVWDMFGIRFAGHPDLRRILMYPEFEGHPLRKDYPLNQRWALVPERDPITQPWPQRTETGR